MRLCTVNPGASRFLTPTLLIKIVTQFHNTSHPHQLSYITTALEEDDRASKHRNIVSFMGVSVCLVHVLSTSIYVGHSHIYYHHHVLDGC